MTVKNCHFLFDGKLYHQKDGVTMGSPLGPLFANIFLPFHERSWLTDCPHTFKPLSSAEANENALDGKYEEMR